MGERNESNWNIENLTDAQVYEAIRYLERDAGSSDEKEGDNGVLIYISLFVALFAGLVLCWLCR
jgi:hypothetical protein